MSGWLLLGLLACGGGETPADGEAGPTAEEIARAESVLEDQAYRFCHEPGMDAAEAQEFCPLLDALDESVCPGLRATCEGAEPQSSGMSCAGGGGGGPGRGTAGQPDRPQRTESCEGPESPTEGMLAVLRWVVALIVALLVLVVLRALWAYFGSDRSVPEVEPLPAVEVEEEEPVLEDVPDLPSGDLLAAARSALDRADYGEAVLLARGAALRRLGDVGKLRLHRSKTDREYARTLRRDGTVYESLREVLVAVEIHRWGGAPLDRNRSESAIAAAARILDAVMLLCLLALFGAPEARAQADRYAPNGDAALQEVLRDWGHDAGFRLRGLDSLSEEVDVLILDQTWVIPDEAGWEAVRAWVEAGGVLWVAGGAVPFEGVGDRVMVDGLAVRRGPVLEELGLPAPAYPGGTRWAWAGSTGVPWVETRPPQGPSDPGAEPIEQGVLDAYQPDLGEALPVVVVVPLGTGHVVAMADARVLWNGAFVHPDNAVFAGDWLHAAQGALGWGLETPVRVELATTAAAESPSPSSSILNADLMPFVIQLLITWTLLGLWMGWPFGPLKDPPEAGRLAFADHVRALGVRWFRIGASRYALAAYGKLWLQRLGPDGIRQAALKAGRDTHRADALLGAIRAAVEDPEGPDSEHDLEWMEELWTITDSR